MSKIDRLLREQQSRELIHGRMISAAYGEGFNASDLTFSHDESEALTRLAHMVLEGWSYFTVSDFCTPLHWDEDHAREVLDGLRDKYCRRTVGFDDGGFCNMEYKVADIDLVEGYTTEDGEEHVVYNFLIDGVKSHAARTGNLAKLLEGIYAE